MRRAYAHVLVSAYQTEDSIIAYVLLDVSNHEINYTLEVSVISWATVSNYTLLSTEKPNERTVKVAKVKP